MNLKDKLEKAKKIHKLDIEIKNHKEAVDGDHRFKEYHNTRMLKLILERNEL